MRPHETLAEERFRSLGVLRWRAAGAPGDKRQGKAGNPLESRGVGGAGDLLGRYRGKAGNSQSSNGH